MMKLVAVFLVIFSQFPAQEAFKIKPRILNGITAPEGKFPHYVFLESWTPEKISFDICGGTLLNDEFVLTAAHCIANITTAAIKVHFTTDILRRPHQVVSVEKQNFFIHPHFDLQMASYDDIGLIRLPNKVQLTSHIQPVRLPTTCEMDESIDVYAMGNGLISRTGTISLKLQYVVLKTLPFENCSNTYPLHTWRESLICALDPKNPSDPSLASSTYRGDSGSPLTKLDGTLIGVTSFGRTDFNTSHPQAFTRVSSYTKWINKVTNLNLPEC